jgi:hypothetical protein
VERAERFRRQVNDDFDRVASAFRSVAAKQDDVRRTGTEAILAILEAERKGVMSRQEAGYFIRYWQEAGDQVRQMIFDDPRYQEIKAGWCRVPLDAA